MARETVAGPLPPAQLSELEALRGHPVVVCRSMMDDDTARMLYECLERMGPTPRLGLVLSTMGGSISTARRIALLFREFTQHLTILIPHRAGSAGTLLCLGADELVMGPMAELSPIDANVGAVWPPPPDAPDSISAEDIRCFSEMAREWFGVDRDEDRLQVLALIAQRVFPPSLSSFYRFDRLARRSAAELLAYQLPDAEDAARRRIVEQLVGGYDAHDHIITRRDAKALGLRVVFASRHEASLLWDLSEAGRKQSPEGPAAPGVDSVVGLIMSATFCARRVKRWVDDPVAPGGLQETPPQARPRRPAGVSWEMED